MDKPATSRVCDLISVDYFVFIFIFILYSSSIISPSQVRCICSQRVEIIGVNTTMWSLQMPTALMRMVLMSMLREAMSWSPLRMTAAHRKRVRSTSSRSKGTVHLVPFPDAFILHKTDISNITKKRIKEKRTTSTVQTLDLPSHEGFSTEKNKTTYPGLKIFVCVCMNMYICIIQYYVSTYASLHVYVPLEE